MLSTEHKIKISLRTQNIKDLLGNTTEKISYWSCQMIKVSLEAKAREYFIFYWLLSSHGNSLFVKGHTLICNVSLQEWLCFPCSCIFVFSLVFVFVSPLLQADGILGASLWPNCRHPGIFSHFSSFPKMNFFLEKLAFSPIPCSCQLVWYKAFFKKSSQEQLSKLAAQKGVVVELPEDQPYHNGPPPTPTSFEALPASLLSDCPPTCLEVVPWQDWNVCLSRMCFDISV